MAPLLESEAFPHYTPDRTVAWRQDIETQQENPSQCTEPPSTQFTIQADILNHTEPGEVRFHDGPARSAVPHHQSTTHQGQQATLDHVNDDDRPKRPLLVRRGALKLKAFPSPLVCIKDWPNGDLSDYVGAHGQWASALTAMLERVDGASCDGGD